MFQRPAEGDKESISAKEISILSLLVCEVSTQFLCSPNLKRLYINGDFEHYSQLIELIDYINDLLFTQLEIAIILVT